MRTLRRLHAKRIGLARPFHPKSGMLPWRRNGDDVDPSLAIDSDVPLPEVPNASTTVSRHPCSFLDEPQFADIMKRFHIVFRFKTGCEYPRSVDGRNAWTTPDSSLSATGRIRVTYKTQDGGARVLDEFVPQESLILCAPGIGKNELAVVVDGLDSGKVVYPSRIARDERKVRMGLYCKLEQKGKKKDEKLYTLNQITRVASLSQDPSTH